MSLLSKTNKVPTKCHRYLINWETIRNRADYDTVSVTSKEEADEAIQNATEFIDFTENYLS